MAECGIKSCEKVAIDRMFWPGNPPMPVCGPCKQRALIIAQVMGFFLHTEPIHEDI